MFGRTDAFSTTILAEQESARRDFLPPFHAGEPAVITGNDFYSHFGRVFAVPIDSGVPYDQLVGAGADVVTEFSG
ncbi:hypothetical protein SDC9_132391 [bioreactor metagenome]|uniref:Uncharacterized protein n=1 Tax=bioreactor metagenome TaxID=1076179 RepID=A0A645D8P1_9ZZZZ